MKEQVTFSQTRIKEIDQPYRTTEQLNQNIVIFPHEVYQPSLDGHVKLAGFEYNEETCELFLSDNYFEIFSTARQKRQSRVSDQFKRK